MPTLTGLSGSDVRGAQMGAWAYCWNGRNRLRKYDGVNWRNAGIARSVFTPTVTPGTKAGAGLTGTYYYFVVPVNSKHLDIFGRACCGIPSVMSAAATPNDQKVTVANIPATHADAQVDQWWIFRNLDGVFYTGISDEENAFYKVAEIAIGTTTYDDEVQDGTIMDDAMLRFNRNLPPCCKAGAVFGDRLFQWGFDPYTTGLATRNATASLIDIAGANLTDGLKGCWFQSASNDTRYLIKSVPSTTQIELEDDCAEALSGAAYSIFRDLDEILVSEWGDFDAWGPDGEAYRWRLKIPGGFEPRAGIELGGQFYIFCLDKMFLLTGKSTVWEDVSNSFRGPIYDGLGAVNKDCVVALDNTIYVLTMRGPARISAGAAPDLIGEKLGLDWMSELAPAELDKAFVQSDGRRVWFAVPEAGQTENGRMYRYDIGTDSWWREDYVHPRCSLRVRNVAGEDKFLYGQGKYIVETETGTRDLAPSGTTSGTVTTGGTTTLAQATAAFFTTGGGLAEAYVHVYRAGSYIGSRRITSNTATQLTWSATGAGGGTLTVAIGDTYEVGSIRWWWKTKRWLPGTQGRLNRLIVGIDGVSASTNLLKTEWVNERSQGVTQTMAAELVVKAFDISHAAQLYEAMIENRTGGSAVGLRDIVLEYAQKPEPKS
jgi:hypothetical protein